jgi:hypothetical protein
MAKVTIAVHARRFIPKTVRTEEFEFLATIDADVASKLSMLRACIREFGRCKGSLYDPQGRQIGWRFEGREKHAGGITHYWETHITVMKGITHVGSFQLSGDT